MTRVLPYWLDALTTELWETGDEQGHMLGSYMCDTCPAILKDLRTLLGRRYMTLLTTGIVSRGDWL